MFGEVRGVSGDGRMSRGHNIQGRDIQTGDGRGLELKMERQSWRGTAGGGVPLTNMT
jgi:hypothetical protein